MKINCFHENFRILDTDEDGFIDKEHIKIKGIPEKIKTMYEPIIKEMNFMKCRLNLKEFIDASTALFKEFTILQRDIFMKFNKSLKTIQIKTPKNSCTFKVRCIMIVAMYKQNIQ